MYFVNKTSQIPIVLIDLIQIGALFEIVGNKINIKKKCHSINTWTKNGSSLYEADNGLAQVSLQKIDKLAEPLWFLTSMVIDPLPIFFSSDK